MTWYSKVVERKSDEDTRGVLKWWISKKHNDRSKDYPADPQGVFKEIERIVENFDPDKVGRGVKAVRSPRRDLALFQAQTAELDLMDSQKEFLARLLQYADVRGTQTDNGVEVEIPYQTLESWAKKKRYQPVLRGLIKLKYLERTSGYKTGKCHSFRVSPSLPL